MRIFNLDSPFMQFLTLVGNLMIVNILTILLCLPIITAGDAFTAMYYVTIKLVRGDDPYIMRAYFKSFKENFKQATIIWLLMLLAAFILITDCYIVFTGMEGTFATVMKVILVSVCVIAVLTCLYVFPVLCRFENTVRHTIKNAFLMSVLNLPRSILIVLIHLLPVVLILVSTSVFPFLFLLGLSVVAYLCSTQYVKIFKKYEPEEEVAEEEEGLPTLSFIVEEEKAKKAAIAAAEAAEREARRQAQQQAQDSEQVQDSEQALDSEQAQDGVEESNSFENPPSEGAESPAE